MKNSILMIAALCGLMSFGAHARAVQPSEIAVGVGVTGMVAGTVGACASVFASREARKLRKYLFATHLPKYLTEEQRALLKKMRVGLLSSIGVAGLSAVAAVIGTLHYRAHRKTFLPAGMAGGAAGHEGPRAMEHPDPVRIARGVYERARQAHRAYGPLRPDPHSASFLPNPTERPLREASQAYVDALAQHLSFEELVNYYDEFRVGPDGPSDMGSLNIVKDAMYQKLNATDRTGWQNALQEIRKIFNPDESGGRVSGSQRLAYLLRERIEPTVH